MQVASKLSDNRQIQKSRIEFGFFVFRFVCNDFSCSLHLDRLYLDYLQLDSMF